VIAVDWSGKAKRAAESIWRAVVVDAQLVELENGLERDELVAWIIDDAKRDSQTPKSIFQIGGAGAVGTGSLRGMRHLALLADSGFAIWPFDEPGWPLVVEIYPRLFTPKGLFKNRHLNRRAHLRETFPEQNQVLLERAAGAEDAFDAAISALAMARHIDELENLQPFPYRSPQLIEGCIWSPRAISKTKK
jgi:hypothetical protein